MSTVKIFAEKKYLYNVKFFKRTKYDNISLEQAMKYYNEYLKVGKQGSAIWKFVEAEMAFIKEEQFMLEGKEPLK